MARVILGVGAGIAAYKACELLRRLREVGHRVRVIPTPDALRFVGAPTWEALSGEPVTTEGLRYGFRVSVVGAPCDPRWRTEEGLALVGG